MRIDKKKSIMLLGMSLLFFLPYFLWGPVGSDSADDTAMNLIAAGAFGEQSQYLTYNNVIYGYFLKILYLILPETNWYLTLQYVFNFLAISSIIVCATIQMGKKRALATGALLHFYFAFEFYEKMQFSENAFLYAITAFIAFYTGQKLPKKKKLFFGIGIFFLVLAGLIRVKCMLMILPFGLLLLFWDEVVAFFRKKELASAVAKRLIDEKRRMIACLLAGLLLCGLNAGLDRLLFWEQEPWKSYEQYHQQGTVPFLDEEYLRDFDMDGVTAAGFIPEDINLLYNYHYMDPEYFSLEELNRLLGYRRTPSSTDTIISSLTETIISLYRMPKQYNDEWGSPVGFWGIIAGLESFLGWNVLFFAFTAYCMVRYDRKQKEKYIFILSVFLLVVAETAFLLMWGRIPRRILIGLRMALELFPGILIFTGMQRPEPEKAGKGANSTLAVKIIPIVTVMLLLFEVTGLRLTYHTLLQRTEIEQVLEEVHQTGSCCVLDGGILWSDRMGVRNPRNFTRSRFDHFFSGFALSGGWVAEGYHNLHFFEEQGIDNPIMSLLEDKPVYYVVRAFRGNLNVAELYIPWMVTYLEHRSGMTVQVEAVYSGNEIMIVRFRKEDKKAPG